MAEPARIDRFYGGDISDPPFPDTATIPGLLARNARQWPDRVAMREKDLGIWHEYTWSDYLNETLAFAAGIEALGFGNGDAMLTLGDPRPQIYFGMLGSGLVGGFPAPVFPDATPREIAYVYRECGARFALAEDQEQVDKLLDMREETGGVETIIYKDPRGLALYEEPGLVDYREVRRAGMKRLEEEEGLRESLMERPVCDDPVIFLHSSGTTGRPKGMFMRHKQLLSGTLSAYAAETFKMYEETMAYVPIAWIGDFAFTITAGISLCFTVNIPERQETLLHDMREIPPTYFGGPPRVWENMLTTVQVRMEESTVLKRRLYNYFISLAMGIQRAKGKGIVPSLRQRLLLRLGEWTILGPIKDNLGLSRAQRVFTGGEAVGENVFLFFRALGINFKQLYGLSESSAAGAIMENNDVRYHTVGKPLPGVEIKITEEGEICIRGDNVFTGYYDNPEATAEAIRDGWLHSGDAGYFEEDGHLVVLGRSAEVVHTASGERYVPNFVENQLKFDSFIKDAAVLGSGRDYLTAMICIDLDAVGHWSEVHGIPYTSYADLSQKPDVCKLIQEAIKKVNALLPPSLQIRRFVNLHKEFDPDDGELTRTRKLRRKVIEERYQPVIETLYSDRDAVEFEAQITYEAGDTGIIKRTLAIYEVA
ncbi:MAG: AMP-binding protein [Deltaproteobacteria bacterium]|nr:AMP-binding protein [Deltaproteobacteria bacterium]